MIASLVYPLYEGTSAVASGTVPGRYHVAIGGHVYMVDTKDEANHLFRTIPVLAEQTDIENEVSEASINRAGGWRRAQDSWHHGAGQSYLDRPGSDNERFRSSKGIDVWTKYEMKLLWDTASRKASSNTNLALVVVGSRLYVTDGTTLAYTTDITVGSPTWTTVTGTPGAATSLASDGNNVLTAHGSSGIYATTRTTGSSSSYVTGTVNVVAIVNGRVMAAAGASLYMISTVFGAPAEALPTAHFTHPNSDFVWVGFASGPTCIYAAGYSGDKSLIYKIPIKADGTGLDAPSLAIWPGLPDGEIVRTIDSHLGFVTIGTDKGFRIATVGDSAGNLNVGELVLTPRPVYAFEGQEHYIWFSWGNFDATSTGLGRMNPTAIEGALAPAYASDLMATAQGDVTSVVTFQNRRVFTVSGVGVFVEDRSNYVASGWLRSGFITYKTPDEKVAVSLAVNYATFVGQVKAYLAEADEAFVNLGTHSSATNTDPFGANNARSDVFEVKLELYRGSATTTPIVKRYTLRSEVAADVGTYHFVPLLLHEVVQDLNGTDTIMDVAAEVAYLRALRRDRSVFVYQDGATNYTVTLEDMEWRKHHLVRNRRAWNGVCTVKLKETA